MTSDLERIAQGLLHYLDANPRLAADLKATAGQCRELAGAVGELTTLIPAAAGSAYHLDAAARACDQAAHLATQATTTGRAWATAAVGNRGSTGSSALPTGRQLGVGSVARPDFSKRNPNLSRRAGTDRALPLEPALDFGALGDLFAPGVHDLRGMFEPKERAIADRLQEEGWRIDARPEIHTVQGLKNPEAVLRKGPDDEGRVVEFKTPNRATGNALKRNMQDNDQLPETGELVIDGRPTGVSAEEADRAYRRVLGQPGHRVAAKIHIILGDGRLVTYPKEA